MRQNKQSTVNVPETEKTPMPLSVPLSILRWDDWAGWRTVPLAKGPRAVSLGVFDGVHLGHRAVIARAAGKELKNGGYAVSAVFSFTRPARSLPKSNAWQLGSDEQTLRVFEGLGVEEWIRADFDAVRNLTPLQFVRDFLHGALDARRVCCGFNYRFGLGGEGTAETLRAIGSVFGIEVVVMDPVEIDGRPVSASRIRRMVEEGRMEEAARLLGRPLTLEFPVVNGQKLGRTLGTPTINQPLPRDFIHPRYGVYAAMVEVDNVVREGVTNVGMRPTVGAEAPLAETWIADYQGDLYGKSVPVALVHFLRDEVRYDTIDELKTQIYKDAAAASRALSRKRPPVGAVLFDFDDTLQDRDKAFLKYSRFFVHKYFPHLPPAVKEARAREMVENNNNGYVAYLDYFHLLFERWNWKNGPELKTIYREFQVRFPEFTTLMPDAVKVLREIRSKGIPVGVITNGLSLVQNRKLDWCGIRPLLDVAVVSGDERVHKPDPEIFRRAAMRLGISCESCLYVGDHWINDVGGSRAAGMRPVYIHAFDNKEPPEAVPSITSLTQLLDMLP